MVKHGAGHVSRLGWVGGGVLVGVVTISTLLVRWHEVRLSVFAATAAKVSAGQVWLLPASALVVDRPVYVGLVAFGLIGFTALRICGAKVFWIAALVGHVGSTLTVYAIISAARLSDPDAFAGAFTRTDVGVSAIQGAWVGAVATTAWARTEADRRSRTFVGAGLVALTGIAWWLHPDPSILTTEHLFAFVFGCCVVSWPQAAASVRTRVDYLTA